MAPQSGPHGGQPASGNPRSVRIPGHGEVALEEIPALRQARDSYMAGRDMPQSPFQYRAPTMHEQAGIARAYDAMPHDPSNPAVRRSYDAMAQETLDQYKSLKDAGLEFKFNEGGADPYAASPAMGYMDMKQNGRLSVFPTSEGFGSSALDVANNPLLKGTDIKFGGKPAVVNDVFRAVHDAYGHFGPSGDMPANPFFRRLGEDRAWNSHSQMYSPEARPAMSTETRGQNSWVNAGPHAEANKIASGADTVFADQKTGLLPDWAYAADPHKWAKGGLPAGAVPSPLSPFERNDEADQ